MPWKRGRPAAIARSSLFVLCATILAVVVVALVYRLHAPLGLLGIGLSFWLVLATFTDLGMRIGLPSANAATALRRLVGLPRSAWGMYLGHIGLAIAAAGVVAVSIWRIEAIQIQQPGQAVDVGEYQFTLVDVGQTSGPNYQASVATIKVERDGQLITLLFPERRWYPVEKQPTTEAAISTRWHGDLYAVLGDPNGSGSFVTRFYYNPGVPWMWFGAALIALAGLVSLTDRRLRIGAPSRHVEASPQPAE